ncbi:MAG: DUF6377 domain-containing protein [Candidatus Amulumruptor caecigallinarius]|nr:DUF6377 domain-containing protein [Candidatus Amulumruptor caecigallinarius]MCM1396266.1 DUF6377 domain-containing protein [Candidatus Amulumruptor caecigallinarius]MCM1454260.1 DUF6377 domain-containing protein [bacterium]
MNFHHCCKTVALIAVLALTIAGCRRVMSDHEQPLSELDRLDSAIRAHPQRLAAKQVSLDSLTHIYNNAHGEEKLVAADRLYSAYNSFDLDSAAHYAIVRARLATELGLRKRASEAWLNNAIVNLSQGHEEAAREGIVKAAPDTVFPEVQRLYYDAMESNARLQGQDPAQWMARLSETLDSTSTRWVYNESNLLRTTGRYREALQMLADHDSLVTSTPHHRAITAYLRGQLLLACGDSTAALKQLTMSATHDLTVPVRDYKSFYELIQLLLAKGDVTRAHSYINFAIDDARSARVLDNLYAVNELMPAIVKAREKEIAEQRRHALWFGIALAALAVALACALIIVYRSRTVAETQRRKAVALNRQLELSNDNMEEANEGLRRLNSELKESNDVKNAYLMQYFNLCSQYLGRSEQLTSAISAAARSRGIEGVEKVLAHIDSERDVREFYANFDTTFLQLFPHFVSRFNELIEPASHLKLRSDGTMPNELRTFALIRLGVTDSAQIATFLRRSVSTIYNYRVKLRNAALGERSTFESRVAEIQP